jgi:ElaB/YqjD/DUF883 family membrane-anchored ribosome-binding protein
MAQRSPIVAVTNERTDVVSWPARQQPVSQARPTESVHQAFETGVAAAERSLRSAQREFSRTTKFVIDRVRGFTDRRPLHFVGVIAGAAFLAGVGLRIWRSRHYE